ncbi:hypothetical protein GJ842_22805 [Salmonella enterica]|uniref:Uncharacterized protein n=1 Tax=Salmonella enterica TaxID=28901 RepID=A0A7U5YN04_SALER|nr:hypothetical protein [Salmonella enterica]AXD70217.1 hypothetical protein CHC34_04100 [Salmonella enterica]EAP0957011.1 hypothetical protein [Salmonella enterica]EDZ9931044.1 hypothetical protein [Salmonella enterica]EJC5047584.1 hypothetical protein [Salmonella enterica]EJD3030340.1 hypothetical protein [Salmonella enterica]
MALDIRGGLKNTKLSKNPYVVFEELISNSIDSYLIRKYYDQYAPDMRIDIEVDVSNAGMFKDMANMEVICKDNGCGLGDEQLKAFLTMDTSYKDDLSIPGIGKCKGAGRIQYFHYFSVIDIASVYTINNECFKRELSYVDSKKEITESDVITAPCDDGMIGTSIRLSHLKDQICTKITNSECLSESYSANVLSKSMLLSFLQRLIGLEEQLGDFEIEFKTIKDSEIVEVARLKRDDLPGVTSVDTVSVQEYDAESGTYLGTSELFKVSHYKLDSRKYGLSKNSIALCAKSSPVKDITSRYLRSRSEQNNAVNGFHHIVMIESEYLDLHVNEQRDDFDNIPEEFVHSKLFANEDISYSSIYEKIDPIIRQMVGPVNWKKEDVIKTIINNFGISEKMLQETSTRIVYGDTPQDVAERVLKKYQEKVLDETAEIMNLKEEIAKSEPDTDDFREKINNLSWKYTASLKNIDMANLSQVIVRRAAIIEVLSLACGQGLNIQAQIEGSRRKDERIIHSIFFPMRKDSNDVTDHDIWLLSEEYHYYDYIASDMPLSKLKWDDGSDIFSSEIDVEMQALLNKRSNDNGAKRPDIAIFNKEGSVIIVEFKAPGVNMDEHVGDLIEYSHLLAAKSNGRLKKFYGYLIGDRVNPLRLNGWTKFPLGNGWFQSNPLQDPTTGVKLGETYFEILHFEDVIERAKKRIGVYQNKLNLKLDIDELNLML